MKFRPCGVGIDHVEYCYWHDKYKVAETNHQDGPCHFQVPSIDLPTVFVTESTKNGGLSTTFCDTFFYFLGPNQKTATMSKQIFCDII